MLWQRRSKDELNSEDAYENFIEEKEKGLDQQEKKAPTVISQIAEEPAKNKTAPSVA